MLTYYTVWIWNPDESGFQMAEKELSLHMAQISNGIWNSEAFQFESGTNAAILLDTIYVKHRWYLHTYFET